MIRIRAFKPKLIVVDTDPRSQRTIAEAVRSSYQVIGAVDPRWALAWLGQWADVVVLAAAQLLPGRRGDALLAQARVMRPDVMRVLLASRGSDALVASVLANGIADRVLETPFDRAAAAAAFDPDFEVSPHRVSA